VQGHIVRNQLYLDQVAPRNLMAALIKGLLDRRPQPETEEGSSRRATA
jgi:hypothetical protein